jgi:hypothetical protein
MLGEIKTCNSTKIGHILCIENKIIKDLMNTFLNWHWIYKKIGQFKQKNICKFIQGMKFQLIF